MKARTARRTAAIMAVALAAATTAGCVSPRNTLGTTSSPCFRAVPVASEAVHDRGRLAGIRLVAQKELRHYPHILDLLAARVGSPVHQVCVMSFHGRFTLDGVERPAGRAPVGQSGPVAIVIVTSPGNRLVATFVLRREPLPLRHEVLGVYPSSRPSSRPSSSTPGPV